MSEWTQMQFDLDLDDDEPDEEGTTDAFIKGALEGRFGHPQTAATPQTAFVVVIDANGDVEAHADPSKFPKYTLRPASLGDIRRACNEIVTEINLQTGARLTVSAIAPEETKVKDTMLAALQDRGIKFRK